VRRADATGDADHFLGGGHFQVHARLQGVRQQLHVAVLNVPAVFAQVHGDAVGAGLLGDQRGLHRVRVAGAAGLAQGGHVIDVDAEKNGHGGAPAADSKVGGMVAEPL